MTKQIEALKLALEALEYISSHYMSLPKIGCMALAAIEEALTEQPAQQQDRQDFTDMWTGYLKDGETPFERFMRERKDLDALMKLYQRVVAENVQLKAAQQQEPVQTTPNFEQLKQILDNLDRCHHRDSKQEFLRTWVRDWTVHKLKNHTSPPQRKPWVGLTDEEIKKIWGSYFSRGIEFARAIEAAHGIKEQP